MWHRGDIVAAPSPATQRQARRQAYASSAFPCVTIARILARRFPRATRVVGTGGGTDEADRPPPDGDSTTGTPCRVKRTARTRGAGRPSSRVTPPRATPHEKVEATMRLGSVLL